MSAICTSKRAKIDHLLSLATYDGIIKTLKDYRKSVEKKCVEEIVDDNRNESNHTANQTLDNSDGFMKSEMKVAPVPAAVPDLGLTYVPIENFAWDQVRSLNTNICIAYIVYYCRVNIIRRC